jgi:hypothetical protein
MWAEVWCDGSCIEEEREGFVFLCLHPIEYILFLIEVT